MFSTPVYPSCCSPYYRPCHHKCHDLGYFGASQMEGATVHQRSAALLQSYRRPRQRSLQPAREGGHRHQIDGCHVRGRDPAQATNVVRCVFDSGEFVRGGACD